MTRWAQDRRTYFVEEPVWGDTERPRWETQVDPSGVRVMTPRLATGLDDVPAVLRALVDGLFEDEGIVDHIAWYYTPMARTFTRHLAPRAIVYDCMDELSAFAGAPPELPLLERELLDKATVVFTGGHHLYAAKRHLHANIHPFPSSVDVAHFRQARDAHEEPADQASIPHPRLGFFGVVDERFDAGLIRELAARHPEWSFVLVGPTAKIDPASLPRGPNVFHLGMKAYAELPRYLAGWDVALLPFALNEATRYISPTKTPEYLAGGLPVVSTAIHDVIHPYEREGLVRIGRTTDEFEASISAALTEDRATRLDRVDPFLSGMSWDRTFQQMKRLADPSAGAEEPGAGAGRPRVRRPAFDYLVAGAGFAGSVMAERLASSGKRVLLVDRRPHLGGNAYDRLDESGVRIHQYGPHIFHTNSAEVFGYLSRFTGWRAYEHRVLASVDGKLVPIPINLTTLNTLYGLDLDEAGAAAYLAGVAEPRSDIRTSEDVIISKVGRDLYEKFFRNYTLKQWGVDPSGLDSSVIARIPVRTNRDDRYFTDSFQAMPADGYTALFERMVDHPNITVELGADSREVGKRVSYGELIYSGPVDEYFGCCFGKLPYRSLQFRFERRPVEQVQPVAVINHPNEHPYTRVTEFKHLTGQTCPTTTLVYEYPTDHGDPYYPVPNPANAELYRKYQALARKTPRVHFVGRLGTYRYYNMDQVVAQALTLASTLVGVKRSELLTQQRA